MVKVNRTVLADTVPTFNEFSTGGTVRTRNDVFVGAGGGMYRYLGALPYTVQAGTKPDSNWEEITDTSLRLELKSTTGASSVGTTDGGTVQEALNQLKVVTSNSLKPVPSKVFEFKQSVRFLNNTFSQVQPAYVEGKFHYAPTLTVLPDGTIISVYTVKTKAIDPAQDYTPMFLEYAVSKDGGTTWSTHTLVNKGTGYATSESVIVHNKLDGLLYVFYTSFKGITGWGHSEQGFNEDTTAQIEYVVSKDSGSTWSTPRNITSKVKPESAFMCSVAPTQCGYLNGNLIVPMYYLTGKNSGITESYFSLSTDGVFSMGDVVRTEYQTDTVGRSGGEIGYSNYSNGEVFAIERAWDDTSKQYRIAQHKLLHRRDDGTWFVKGQFATSDCQASFLRVGLEHGYNKEYLFVIAPIGTSGALDGRKNMRVFDCSNDFSNPVDVCGISVDSNVATEYSSTALLPTGAFISTWHGRQWLIHNTVYTLNRRVGSKIIQVPFWGAYKVVDTENGQYKFDLRTGEKVIGTDSVEYTWNGTEFVSTNVDSDYTITSSTSTVDYTKGTVQYFDSGTAGSVITKVIGGTTGSTLHLLILSGSTTVELSRAASGVPQGERIMFSDSADGTKYKFTGGTGIRSSMVTLVKTKYGWYLDKFANTN